MLHFLPCSGLCRMDARWKCGVLPYGSAQSLGGLREAGRLDKFGG